MSQNLAEGIRWDLSDLYASIEDPKTLSDLKIAESKALEFAKKYRPHFENLVQGSSVDFDMAGLLEDYQQILTLVTKPAVFSHLSFAEQTNEPQRGAFLQKVQDLTTEIETHLLFWDVY